MAQLRPIRAVTDEHRELPPVHMGHSDKFFDYLVERSQGGKVLPTWKGEQYLNQFPDVLPGFAIVAWSTTRHQEAVRRGGEADQEMFALNVGLDGNTLHLATQLEFAKVSVVAQGPLRASVRVEVVCWQSRISVTVRGFAVVRASVHLADSMRRRSRLTLSQSRRNSTRARYFASTRGWTGASARVQVEPLLALSSDNSIYKTQFDWVQRPTHKNTMWG
ncbi:hypothetical protein DFH08DRAFT_1090181 [Mycena albidolilacea]|uniref:Uncharacterized protein n=2 Tax=Mycena albidolilacea TaxID=1033008 RepID=A0AAD6YY61_9AGAR|nr:hypothetical protein DFH08DRAFT_1090181 [Mycena albidolilacea]